MAVRRRRDLAAPEAPAVDDAALERRARWLIQAVTVRACDPPAELPGTEKVRRVDEKTRDLPMPERVAAIEAVLDELGYLAMAERRVAHLLAGRARWEQFRRGGAA